MSNVGINEIIKSFNTINPDFKQKLMQKTNVILKQKILIEKSHVNNSTQWIFRDSIDHISGRFFNIKNVDISNNDQLVLFQNDTGILGLLGKKINDILMFLVQLKIEPGNNNIVQVSPTLQATKSNIERIHRGASPKYLDYFMNNHNQVIFDTFQNESTDVFYKKRNRNMVLITRDEVEVESNFMWLSLGEISSLIKEDYTVNMDLRSVFSLISIMAYNFQESKFCFDKKIQQRINYYKQFCDSKFTIKKIPQTIYNNNIGIRKYTLMHINVLIESRENAKWDQPILKSNLMYHHILLIKGSMKSLRIGISLNKSQLVYDNVELHNTLTFLEDSIPDYVNTILNNGELLQEVYHSNEGGRFLNDINKYIVCRVPSDLILDNVYWLNIQDIYEQFIKENNTSIELRTFIALLDRESI